MRHANGHVKGEYHTTLNVIKQLWILEINGYDPEKQEVEIDGRTIEVDSGFVDPPGTADLLTGILGYAEDETDEDEDRIGFPAEQGL